MLKGLAELFLLGVEPRLDSHARPSRSPPRFPQQLDRTPPSFRLSSFTLHGHQSLPLRVSTRPLLPPPCPSARALFVSYPLTSLAGHWFGFALPSLSLGGASVVAEENRYPFYVFIISQIKKLMN